MPRGGDADAIVFVGDVVGLGPEPEECIQILRERGARCVLGDHDRAILGDVAAKFVEIDYLAESLRWTAEQLSRESVEYLRTLPRELTFGPFTVTHAFSDANRLPVVEDFSTVTTRHALIGHNHVPLIWSDDGSSRKVPRFGGVVALDGGRFIVNPGAVGMSWLVPGVANYATCVVEGDATTVQFDAATYDLPAYLARSRAKQPGGLVRFWDDYANGRNPAGARARALHAPYLPVVDVRS